MTKKFNIMVLVSFLIDGALILKGWVNRFFFRLSCVFGYVKLAWQDQDWDFVYLLLVIQHKLRRMRVHFVTHDIVENAQKIGSLLKELEDAIDRVIDDDFCKELYSEHDEKWGEISFEREPVYGLDGEVKFWRVETQRKNVVTEEDKENEKEEFSKIMKKHVDQREEDVKKVFDTMRDNLQSWWD